MRTAITCLIYLYFLFQNACVHKEISIKEVYFSKEPLVTNTKNVGIVKKIEKCNPRITKLISEEIRFNQDSDQLFDIIELAFLESKQKSWFNVEINRVEKGCTILEGKYYEE